MGSDPLPDGTLYAASFSGNRTAITVDLAIAGVPGTTPVVLRYSEHAEVAAAIAAAEAAAIAAGGGTLPQLLGEHTNTLAAVADGETLLPQIPDDTLRVQIAAVFSRIKDGPSA